MKQFELWLDESGKFADSESQREEIYSFLGGVLVEKAAIKNFNFSSILNDDSLNHAMNMTPNQKKQYVIPKLIEFKNQTDARYIFFENIEWQGNGDNRQLYLQILSEGLVQLTQLLEAKYGDIRLNIIIASRVARKGIEERVHIQESEYKRSFTTSLKTSEVSYRSGTDVQFQLKKATESQKLILADFASNIRRMYLRDLPVFRDQRAVLRNLFEDSYVFSLSTLSSDSRIRFLLAQNDVSEALMEYYTSQTIKTKGTYLHLIVDRMKYLSYRVLKSQLKQFASEILAYTARQDDYEKSIEIFTEICDQLLPLLRDKRYPYELFTFEVFLQLSDVYLRSGRSCQAGQVISQSLELVKISENSLENLFSLYRIKEKLAVFYIDSGQYKKASHLMADLRVIFKELLDLLLAYDSISNYFQSLKSEYYGDVLCMEIYSLLFQTQQEDFKLETIIRLSDEGLQQYPSFPGELERHRQYRSRIELLRKDAKAALHWLILAIDYDHRMDSEIDDVVIQDFWDRVERQETTISQQFYAMYYSLIMTEAYQQDIEFAKLLYTAFVKHPIYQEFFSFHKRNKLTKLVTTEKIFHHPMEIVYWNFANYYRFEGKMEDSLNCYDKAIKVCMRNQDSFTLELRSIPIYAAKISCEKLQGKKSNTYEKLKTTLHQLEKMMKGYTGKNDVDFSETEELLREWENFFDNLDQKSETISDKLWSFSQKWRY